MMRKGFDLSEFQRWEFWPESAGLFPENAGRYPGVALPVVRRINAMVAAACRRSWKRGWWFGWTVGLVMGAGGVVAAGELWKVVSS